MLAICEKCYSLNGILRTRACRTSDSSVALTKWLVNRSLESDRATAFAEEALAQDLNMATRDSEEGVAAFVERRDPDYRGW